MPLARTPEREKGDTTDTAIEDRRKTFSKVPIQKKMDKAEKYRKEKPEEFCKGCDRHVQHGIACENCEYWYHPECEKVSPEEYEFLLKNQVTTSLWYCKQCREDLADLADKKETLNSDYKKITQYQEDNENLKKENDLLKRENEVMKGKVVEIEKEVNIIKNGLQTTSNEPMMNTMMNMLKEVIKTFKEEAENDRKFMMQEIIKTREDRETLKEEISEIVTSQVKELLEEKSRSEEQKKAEEKEESEIREKQTNLILFNVQEPRNEIRGRDREDEEYKIVDEIIGRGVGVTGFTLMNVKRIGIEREGKVKPLLVRLQRAEKKWEIMRNVKNLSKAPMWMRKIGIVPDLTRRQRDRDKDLRDQLKEKKDNGETGWYIKKGELMRSEPVEDREESFHESH